MYRVTKPRSCENRRPSCPRFQQTAFQDNFPTTVTMGDGSILGQVMWELWYRSGTGTAFLRVLRFFLVNCHSTNRSTSINHLIYLSRKRRVCRGADKSLVFPISYFPICSTTRRIFLGWVKEVRTTKSYVCGDQGEYVNTFFHSRSLLFSL
jgi:hypothetical protein